MVKRCFDLWYESSMFKLQCFDSVQSWDVPFTMILCNQWKIWQWHWKHHWLKNCSGFWFYNSMWFFIMQFSGCQESLIMIHLQSRWECNRCADMPLSVVISLSHSPTCTDFTNASLFFFGRDRFCSVFGALPLFTLVPFHGVSLMLLLPRIVTVGLVLADWCLWRQVPAVVLVATNSAILP